MSDKGQEDHDDTFSLPISAVPPRVILQEESQIEVSSSPAFQCLDEVSFMCYFYHLHKTLKVS